MKKCDSTEKSFEKAKSLLTWNHAFLSCLGLWPKENKFIFWPLYYCFTYHYSKDFIALYMTLSSHSLMKVIGTGLECISTTQVWVRFWTLKNYNKDLVGLLREFGKDYSIKNYKTDEEKKIFLNYSLKSKKFVVVAVWSLAFTAILYFFQPLLRQISFSKNANVTLKYDLPYKFPTIYKINGLKIYLLTYASRLSVIMPTIAVQFSIDSMTLTILTHLSSQLGVLSCRIRNISPTHGSEELKKILRRHQKLIEIGLHLRQVYTNCLLIHFIGATTGIGIIIYQFLRSIKNLRIVNLALFFMYAFVHIYRFFIYCWGAQCLINESINVSDAYYASKWYEMPVDDQKRILYGIHRSQKPLVLTGATSKCYSLEIFAKVMKSALAYLSFLRRFM